MAHRHDAGSDSRPRVLSVDDDAFVRRMMTTCLGGDFELTLADCGAAALELLGAGAEFDAVLLDLRMPEVCGRDVLRWMERERPELVPRTGIVTGGSSDAEDCEFLETTSRPVLLKPFGAGLLPDCFAARSPGALLDIEQVVEEVERVGAIKIAAHIIRGHDVLLPAAVRWTRRRIGAGRTARVTGPCSGRRRPCPSRSRRRRRRERRCASRQR